jgi:hypothetical protein
VSDEGSVNGEFVDSPTVNAYVVGVEVVPPPPGGYPPISPPVPAVIDSLNPATVPAGARNFTLHIYGSMFDPSVTVWFDGVAVNTGYVNGAQVDTAVESTAIATARDIPVWIVDAGGESNHVALVVT